MMKTALELIAAERQRQIDEEGWTVEHDDGHEENDLANAAACYAMESRFRIQPRHFLSRCGVPKFWPWGKEWWKPTPYDRERELVKAGALIVAEIERLNRLETR